MAAGSVETNGEPSPLAVNFVWRSSLVEIAAIFDGKN